MRFEVRRSRKKYYLKSTTKRNIDGLRSVPVYGPDSSVKNTVSLSIMKYKSFVREGLFPRTRWSSIWKSLKSSSIHTIWKRKKSDELSQIFPTVPEKYWKNLRPRRVKRTRLCYREKSKVPMSAKILSVRFFYNIIQYAPKDADSHTHRCYGRQSGYRE